MPESDNSFPSLVSADWLLQNLNDNDIRVVEASWHMPATGRNAREEFTEQHVTGAVFFDIDEHCAQSTLPHMLPEPRMFASAVSSMGIANEHQIVVYDSLGLFSAARVWWMFRHYGANRVAVLDGGLPAWKRAGGPVCSSAEEQQSNVQSSRSAGDFKPNTGMSPQVFSVAESHSVMQASTTDSTLIIDARSANRFMAIEPEVRPGLVSGHIPNSVNLPFTELLDDQALLKSRAELSSLFSSIGLENHHQVITSCGSGVTAAVLILALTQIEHPAAISLYDGSWSEWGSLPDVPVDTGTSKRQ